ncbi:GNAT family N-acetyltransferase [Luteipulveratus flavus]|uniref:GNAT family N-acetyltransferase n=1 Tax=Luteipulveratus flavus TaxID=3031728 RepID=A0ABT6C7Y5_9MICO|nr:GNAT family N-acetyltransferase [Luteipulveratus sp. YIM 133296]MDF8264983.1 GNAT family N-acetyltransferase [Luteipulveratus sp. YIM 133296]
MNDDPSEPHLTASLRVGMRIVVRFAIAGDGDASEGGPTLTDAVGELLRIDERALVVRTRRGEVTVEQSRVVAAKEIPPAPSRRGRPHLAVSMTDLQELMVEGMPPLHQEWLGRWLLRSSDGYTGRGNSVLPLGDPGVPLDDAMSRVQAWYAERGRPPLVQLYGPTGFDVARDELGAWALAHGWRVFQQTLVLTGPVEALAAAPAPGLEVAVHDRADDAWFAGATAREQEHADTLRAMLARIEDASYLVASHGDEVGAIGRVAYGSAWAGVFALHVRPDLRRRGLGRALLRAAGQDAQSRGVRSAYLQVSADNEAAVELYRSLGFDTHHEYWYARP